MLTKIKDYQLLLASNSPRRKELLRGLELDFKTIKIPVEDESYPVTLEKIKVPEFIANKKADAIFHLLANNALAITADTVVILDNEILEKPTDEKDAVLMLKKLSGKTHHVVTGVCLITKNKRRSFYACSEVTFSVLSEADITYYVNTYKPLDKAGAYGIQEWIGFIGIESIKGSYFNVMGLPVQRLYKELNDFL